MVAAGNSGRDNSSANDGYGTITAPGNSPSAITVGAMNTLSTPGPFDDKVTSYSSKGPTAVDHYAKPDLVAPGNRILSLRDSGSILDQEQPENRGTEYSTVREPRPPRLIIISSAEPAWLRRW